MRCDRGIFSDGGWTYVINNYICICTLSIKYREDAVVQGSLMMRAIVPSMEVGNYCILGVHVFSFYIVSPCTTMVNF